MTSESPIPPPPPPPPPLPHPHSPPPPPLQERGTDADGQVTDLSVSKKAKKEWRRPTFIVLDADMKRVRSGSLTEVQENAVYHPSS